MLQKAHTPGRQTGCMGTPQAGTLHEYRAHISIHPLAATATLIAAALQAVLALVSVLVVQRP